MRKTQTIVYGYDQRLDEMFIQVWREGELFLHATEKWPKEDGTLWEKGDILNLWEKYGVTDEPKKLLAELRFGVTGERIESPAFLNYYRHCGTEWEDIWSCTCNDRCPECNKEITPYKSIEI